MQPNDVCVSVGWRFPVNGELDLQQYNEFLPMPMYDSNECNTTSHYAGFITKYNICVGLSNIDKELCYVSILWIKKQIIKCIKRKS